jgi:membrane protein
MRVNRRPLLIMREVWVGFGSHDLTSRAASVAFFTLFSLAPLSVLVVFLLAQALGEPAARGEVSQQLAGVLGDEQAKQVEELVLHTKLGSQSVTASIVGLIGLLIGATGVFAQLTYALSAVWGVTPKSFRHGVWIFIRRRLVGLALVVAMAVFILASAIASAVVAATSNWLSGRLPQWAEWLSWSNTAVTLAVTAVAFALMFKTLPSTRVPWPSVWLGSIITAILFWIGKWAVGVYLGVSGIASAYGAAGSLVVLLLWVYYTAFIVLLGAEICRAWAATDLSQPTPMLKPDEPPDPRRDRAAAD